MGRSKYCIQPKFIQISSILTSIYEKQREIPNEQKMKQKQSVAQRQKRITHNKEQNTVDF